MSNKKNSRLSTAVKTQTSQRSDNQKVMPQVTTKVSTHLVIDQLVMLFLVTCSVVVGASITYFLAAGIIGGPADNPVVGVAPAPDLGQTLFENNVVLVKFKAEATDTRATINDVLSKPLKVQVDAATNEVIQQETITNPALQERDLVSRDVLAKAKNIRPIGLKERGGKQLDNDTKIALDRIGLERWQRITLDKPTDIIGLVEEFRGRSDVEAVEPAFLYQLAYVPNDPYYNTDLQNPPVYSWNQKDGNGNPYPDLWGLKEVNMGQAWDTSQGSSNVIVGIVDTGVDYNHPDLAANIWTNAGETGLDSQGRDKKSNGVDDDGNGFIDDWHGWDFANNTNNPIDSFGHGTHIAGTIAGLTNNSAGVAGICPNCKVMALRTTTSGASLSTAALAAALQYAADMGAKIANNSWGGIMSQQVINDAVQYAYARGMLPVFAAGNSSTDANQFYPNLGELMTVAAWEPRDQLASFSNYGSRIDVAAPGFDILSLKASGTDMYGDGKHTIGNNYYRASGTSMAAPHVAGLSALILSAHPTYTAEQIRQAIRIGADDVGATGWDTQTGYGRLNAAGGIAISDPCSARILSPSSFTTLSNLPSRTITISGTATCPSLKNWKLEYGSGLTPTSWTTILQSTSAVTNGTLKENWDSSVLAARGEYIIRLTVTDMTNRVFVDRLQLHVGPTLRTGFPVSHNSDMGLDLANPLGADVNNDEKEELVIHSHAIQSDGTEIPGWPITKAGLFTSAVGEILPDSPGKEVVIPSADAVHLFRANGTEVTGGNWPKALNMGYTYTNNVSIADLDRDGANEIVVQSCGDYKIHVLKNDGTEKPGFPVSSAFNAPVIGDFDADPQLELIILNHQGLPIVYNHDGTRVTVSNWWYYALSQEQIGLLDVNNDGKLDMVGLDDYGNQLFVQSFRDPAVVWNIPTNIYMRGGSFPSSVYPSTGDIDGDGHDELVIAAGDQVHVIKKNGTELAGYPVTASGLVNTNPLIIDADNDGHQDILVNSWFGLVYAFDRTGQPIAGFPFSINDGDSLVWNSIGSASLLGNGKNDILTAEMSIMGSGSAKAFSLQGNSGPWTMFGKNAQHVLSIDSDEDGVYDDYERAYGMSTTGTGGNDVDTDNDGLTNFEEFQHGTKANSADSDGDGVNDAVEIANGSDPNNPDSPTHTSVPQIRVSLVDGRAAGFLAQFQTNESTQTYIEYGLTTAYGSTTPVAPLNTSFGVIVHNLPGETMYHGRVVATDAYGFTSHSDDFTVTTWACTPFWSCTAWSSCTNGQQTRTCTDNNSCAPDPNAPPTTQTCTCQESWTCGSWSACTNGQQTRTCTDAHNCGTTNNRPALSQSCSAPPCQESWTCGSWSACTNGQQTRTCTDRNNCGTTTNKPVISQTCTVSCTESWTCSGWSACTGNQQTRHCVDGNNCSTTTNKPVESQWCYVPPAPPCQESWTCDSWSVCTNGQQTRACTDRNNCGTFQQKPSQMQRCQSQPSGTTLSIKSNDPKIFAQGRTKNASKTMTIIGTGFTNSTKVQIGSFIVQTKLVNPRSLLVQVPIGRLQVGKYTLVVSQEGQQSVRIARAITIRGPKPSITGIRPSTVSYSKDNKVMRQFTVTGHNFFNGMVVYVNGRPAQATVLQGNERAVIYLKPYLYKKGSSLGIYAINPDDQRADTSLKLRLQ